MYDSQEGDRCEFLVIYDGTSKDRPSFVPTSNRIVFRNQKPGSYSIFALCDIESFKHEGLWKKNYTLKTFDGSHTFTGLGTVPKEEIQPVN